MWNKILNFELLSSLVLHTGKWPVYSEKTSSLNGCQTAISIAAFVLAGWSNVHGARHQRELLPMTGDQNTNNNKMCATTQTELHQFHERKTTGFYWLFARWMNSVNTTDFAHEPSPDHTWSFSSHLLKKQVIYSDQRGVQHTCHSMTPYHLTQAYPRVSNFTWWRSGHASLPSQTLLSWRLSIPDNR